MRINRPSGVSLVIHSDFVEGLDICRLHHDATELCIACILLYLWKERRIWNVDNNFISVIS